MPKRSFEEMALEYRDKSRKRYSKALSEQRGPAPYSKVLTEEQQDEMWGWMDPQYVEADEAGVTAAIQQGLSQYSAVAPNRDAAMQLAVLSAAQQYPQSAFLRLMLPKEAGGEGLTPLAASYRKYPHRPMLVEGAGAGIEDQTAYASGRQKRMAEKPPSMVTQTAVTDHSASFAASPKPMPASASEMPTEGGYGDAPV